jgi:hypothetical protein
MLKAKARIKCVTFSFLCCYGNTLMTKETVMLYVIIPNVEGTTDMNLRAEWK